MPASSRNEKLAARPRPISVFEPIEALLVDAVAAGSASQGLDVVIDTGATTQGDAFDAARCARVPFAFRDAELVRSTPALSARARPAGRARRSRIFRGAFRWATRELCEQTARHASLSPPAV
ncbi:MAG TPA: hypothetical protein VMG12_02585 [Polyangiaceae bacterium]|nr:hypothetical protein [Polyangiaceae bacterium]